MAITLSQSLPLGSVHLLQAGEAQIMHMFHLQDLNPSLGMAMPPTKDAILNPIMEEGLPMGAEMTPILPMVCKVTQIIGSENKGTLLL